MEIFFVYSAANVQENTDLRGNESGRLIIDHTFTSSLFTITSYFKKPPPSKSEILPPPPREAVWRPFGELSA